MYSADVSKVNMILESVRICHERSIPSMEYVKSNMRDVVAGNIHVQYKVQHVREYGRMYVWLYFAEYAASSPLYRVAEEEDMIIVRVNAANRSQGGSMYYYEKVSCLICEPTLANIRQVDGVDGDVSEVRITVRTKYRVDTGDWHTPWFVQYEWLS